MAEWSKFAYKSDPVVHMHVMYADVNYMNDERRAS